MKLLGIFFLFFLILSCKKNDLSSESELAAFEVEDLPQDFKIPSWIWEEIEAQVIPPAKPKIMNYGPISIKLTEKNKGVLIEKSALFKLPSGGGELDLSKLVTGQAGTFFLGFDIPIQDKVLSKKVFFISQSRQRKVENEIIGSGCNKVLDLSSSLKQLEFKDLLKLNTTRNRHISVLGGHFVFLLETESSWIVSQVTFYDSNRKDLFCPGFRNREGKK